jgi:hypothetical protein
MPYNTDWRKPPGRGASVWSSAKKTIQYIVGCVLCLIGIVAAFSGQLTVSKNGGRAHPVHYGQYIVGGVFFLAGVLFIVAARRRAKRSWADPALSPDSYPPMPPGERGIPEVRDESFAFDSNEQRWRPKGEFF